MIYVREKVYLGIMKEAVAMKAKLSRPIIAIYACIESNIFMTFQTIQLGLWVPKSFLVFFKNIKKGMEIKNYLDPFAILLFNIPFLH